MVRKFRFACEFEYFCTVVHYLVCHLNSAILNSRVKYAKIDVVALAKEEKNIVFQSCIEDLIEISSIYLLDCALQRVRYKEVVITLENVLLCLSPKANDGDLTSRLDNIA